MCACRTAAAGHAQAAITSASAASARSPSATRSPTSARRSRTSRPASRRAAKREKAREREKARKKRQAEQHPYESCRDDECKRPLCVAYRTGWHEGHFKGFEEGYAAGYAVGYGGRVRRRPGRVPRAAQTDRWCTVLVIVMERILVVLGLLRRLRRVRGRHAQDELPKCQGWGSRKKRTRRGRSACGKCGATGRQFRPGARARAHRLIGLAVEAIRERREVD